MKPLVIVNPRAGGGTAGRSFGSMRSTIEASLGKVEVAATEGPRHAVELARLGALAGHELIVAIGGDGTFSEVVNGMMQAGVSTARLGIIGQGTGGDFRKTLGLEHRLDRYLDAIASGRERPLDVGKFSAGGREAHYFVNILSAGMGGLVDQYVSTGSRVFGGRAAYFAASLRALAKAKLGHVQIKVTNDGVVEEHLVRSYMIAICNGQFFGGGMKVAPMAAVDDGIFELVVLGTTSKVAFSMTSRVIYGGTHLALPDTVHLRGQKFELDLANEDARPDYLLDVDGEPMGPLPLAVEVVPKALMLRC